MQRDLIRLMHAPKIVCVSGGHLSTVLKVDAFFGEVYAFLRELGE